MSDLKNQIINEYTAADIQAALAEASTGDTKEGTMDSPVEGQRISSNPSYPPSRLAGLGRVPRVSKPCVPGEIPRAELPLINGGWRGEEEVPEYFAKSEKYEHRLIAFRKAQGYSNKEIAEWSGYSYPAVCQILKLPWTKQVIIEEIARNGRDAVQTLLQSSALDTVSFLIEARDDQKAQLRDRITAGKELLDRVFGKPNQPITHREEKDLATLSDDELARIANQARAETTVRQAGQG